MSQNAVSQSGFFRDMNKACDEVKSLHADKQVFYKLVVPFLVLAKFL